MSELPVQPTTWTANEEDLVVGYLAGDLPASDERLQALFERRPHLAAELDGIRALESELAEIGTAERALRSEIQLRAPSWPQHPSDLRSAQAVIQRELRRPRSNRWLAWAAAAALLCAAAAGWSRSPVAHAATAEPAAHMDADVTWEDHRQLGADLLADRVVHPRAGEAADVFEWRAAHPGARYAVKVFGTEGQLYYSGVLDYPIWQPDTAAREYLHAATHWLVVVCSPDGSTHPWASGRLEQ